MERNEIGPLTGRAFSPVGTIMTEKVRCGRSHSMAKSRSRSVPAVTSRMQSRHPMGDHWLSEVNSAENVRQIEEFLISFQRSAACKFNVLTFLGPVFLATHFVGGTERRFRNRGFIRQKLSQQAFLFQ